MSLAIHVACRKRGLTRAELCEHIENEIDFCDDHQPRFEPEAASPELDGEVWDRLDVHYDGDKLIQFQRAEVLSLDKFLHLPVSLRGAFLINYVGSLLSLTMIVLFPGMLGLSLGLVFSHGPKMLLLFPLLAAFVLMVTAVTHQFRGWLAALMSNPRRRRAIIMGLTAAFILIAQAPNIYFNVIRRESREERRARRAETREQRNARDEQEMTELRSMAKWQWASWRLCSATAGASRTRRSQTASARRYDSRASFLARVSPRTAPMA